MATLERFQRNMNAGAGAGAGWRRTATYSTARYLTTRLADSGWAWVS